MFLSACSDPAADKSKAVTGEATETASPAAAAQGTKYLITPQNSKIEFVGSKVTGSHNGSFKQFTGTIELAKEGVEKSRVTIDIVTDSIFTDNERLTGHLKTADFFDVPKHPKANFTSTKIEPATTAGATHTVTGNLDLHGVKKSISFPATIQVAPDAASVNAEFAINRKDFGINYTGKANDLIRDEVVMKLTVKAPRKQ